MSDASYVVKSGDRYLRLMLVPGCEAPAADWVRSQGKATMFASKDDVSWLALPGELRYVRIRSRALQAPSVDQEKKT